MSPVCHLWSSTQELNIAKKSEKYRLELAEDRQHNHDTVTHFDDVWHCVSRAVQRRT